MRKQETGVWSGGMLAVRDSSLINVVDVIIYHCVIGRDGVSSS